MLHVRSEGSVLFDRRGEVTSILSAPTASTGTFEPELAATVRRLGRLDPLAQFNGNYLFCLSRLYTIGKAVAILVLQRTHNPVYSDSAVFEALRASRPELEADLRSIEVLRPFRNLVTARQPAALPFPYHGAEHHVRSAVRGIRQIGVE